MDSYADPMLHYATGNLAAFLTLYERHGGWAVFLLPAPGNSSVAEASFQDVWAWVIQRRKRYRVKQLSRSGCILMRING